MTKSFNEECSINNNILQIHTDASMVRNTTSRVGYIIIYNGKYVSSNIETYKNVTNNFGELKAIDLALEYLVKNITLLQYESIEIFTDSMTSIKLIDYVIQNKGKAIVNCRGKVTSNMFILTNIYKNVSILKTYPSLYFVFSHSHTKSINEEYMKFRNNNHGKRDILVDEFRNIINFNNMCDKMVKPIKRVKNRIL